MTNIPTLDAPTTAASQTRTAQVSARRVAIATAAATLANLVVFGIGTAGGATWQAGQPYPIGWSMVLVASIVPMVLAALVTGLIARRRPGVLTGFAWAGLVFAGLGAPMGYLMGRDLPTGLALGAMHVISGIAWFWAIKPHTAR